MAKYKVEYTTRKIAVVEVDEPPDENDIRDLVLRDICEEVSVEESLLTIIEKYED